MTLGLMRMISVAIALFLAGLLGLPGVASLPAASAQDASDDCYVFDLAVLDESVAAADLIIVATVERADAGSAALSPRAFLKGSVTATAIGLSRPVDGQCPEANLRAGERVLVILTATRDRNDWPGPSQVFALINGRATNQEASPVTVAEAELVERIRSVTGQYAVPAADEDEGASIGWLTTVLPVGLALALLFGVGLVLMRIWHRIDPT